MEWFEEALAAPEATPKRAKRVGFLCNAVPQELFWALGLEGVRIDCGNAGCAQLGDERLSGDLCPLAKASLGAFMDRGSLASSCDALVAPATCDAKRKLAQELNDLAPTLAFAVPPERDYARFSRFALSETERLVQFLEGVAGRRLKAGALLAAVRAGRRRSWLARSFQMLRIRDPQALSYRDLLIVLQSSQMAPLGIAAWLEKAEAVLAWAGAHELEEAKLRARPRLVLTGSPIIWPNFKVLNLLEECGAEIASDTLCSGVQAFADPPALDEKDRPALLRALCNRSIFGSLCPCFAGRSARIPRLLDLASFGAAGVVSFSLRLCQPFDFETPRVERAMRERKMPFLNLRTDYSLEDTEQLRVRIEAFLETLPT